MLFTPIINDLASTDSRLEKERILDQHAMLATAMSNEDSATLLTIFKFAYNSFVTFGVKQVPDAMSEGSGENPWAAFFSLLNDLAQRKLTGNAAKVAISEMSGRFGKEEWNHVAAPCLRRDMRCGVSLTTVNKVLSKYKDAAARFIIPEFACQLATNCEGRPEMKGKKQLERKLDGVRCLIVVNYNDCTDNAAIVTSYSRNGKVYENFGHIEQVAASIDAWHISAAFSNGFVLDGEVTSTDFQTLATQTRRKNKKDNSQIHFNAFDIIPLNDFIGDQCSSMKQRERTELLEKVVTAINSDLIKLVPHIEVNLDTAEGRSVFTRFCDDMVAQGFEGAMVKDLEAPYVCSRGRNWLKYKPVYTYDLTCTAVEEGTGKNKNKMGALLFEGTDEASGKYISVSVGSGYSDAERDLYFTNPSLAIGMIGEVEGDAITKASGSDVFSIRFPRFAKWRPDKKTL
jgi:DNA ligase-1